MTSNEERKPVTIRGIDKELYRKITLLARESGKTIGELINEAMKLLLTTTSAALEVAAKAGTAVTELGKSVAEGVKEGVADYVEIKDINELVLNANDLRSLDKPLVFRNIGRLVISDDVPYELFDKAVRSIVLVDEVVVPSSYPKLLVAAKCRFVKKISHSG